MSFFKGAHVPVSEAKLSTPETGIFCSNAVSTWKGLRLQQHWGRFPRFSCLMLLCALLALPGGCDRTPTDRPNIALITVDTLRPDHLGPYGYEEIETPAVQKLAEEGILFENAFCDVTWTIPSVASIMTGKYAVEHGVRTIYNRLSDDEVTLAEILKAHGYRTAAFVGSAPVDHRFGFSQGFDLYDDDMTTPYLLGKAAEPARDEWFDAGPPYRLRWTVARLKTTGYRPDDLVANEATDWLRSDPHEPFFLWVHFLGPHEKIPRTPKGSEASLSPADIYDRDAYDLDVTAVDRQVGRVLSAIRRAASPENTVVVFHSDHGQTFFEHRTPGHGFDVYDTTARIPLIVRLPGRERASERVTRLVRNVDIFPTLLSLAGVRDLPEVSGRDLLAIRAARPDHTYLESYRIAFSPLTSVVEQDGVKRRVVWGHRGIRTPRWKLIVREPVTADRGKLQVLQGRNPWGPLVELYDLSADPREQRNVAPAEPKRVAEMRAILDSYGSGSPTESVEDLDEATRERLRSLGYTD
jgi:arylsulfatase A-like enzyme